VDGVLLLPHQDHRVPRVSPAAFPGTNVLQHEPGNFILFNEIYAESRSN